MKVSEIMTKNVATIGSGATISEVAQLLIERSISGVPVLDADGVLVGMISESNLLPTMEKVPYAQARMPHLFGEWLADKSFDEIITPAKSLKVSEVMDTEVVSVSPDERVAAAAALMATHDIKRLPVVESDRLVGIITKTDLIRALV